MGHIIGIDLGTTNSCVAVMEGQQPRIIENSEGTRTTPSVVAYLESGEVLIGQAAKRQAVTNPKNTLFAIKRLIGRKFSDQEVQRDISLMPFTITQAKSGAAWLKVHGNELAPPQISAEILKKMKKTAEEYLGAPVTEAVVTVPAYFSDAQRQATKDAGVIAGLTVKRIINEPTAAAMAYGMDKVSGDRTIAVYDLGGGTFDISIIEINSDENGEKTFEVLATNGDTHLGGEDIDTVIMNELVSAFKKEQGIDLSADSLAMQRLKEAAEKAKLELSASQQTEVNLPFITADASGPKHLQLRLTRAKLEALIQPLIERTLEPVKTALADAKLTVSQIQDVILVGGQTRMPLVQKMVANFFGKEARKDVNPDEAVALGAAIQAGVLSGSVQNVLLLDVTPLSLGIETNGNMMTPLIAKNTTIPTRESSVFTTAIDNQPGVTVRVLQGERKRSSDNKLLGQFQLDGIRPAARGIPKIEVTFDIDANGILKVSAKDQDTGKEQKITIEASSGLSKEEIERMRQDAEVNAEQDRQFEELVKVRNMAEASVYETSKKLEEHEKSLKEETLSAIKAALGKVQSTINGEDKAAIEESLKELQELPALQELIQASYKTQGEAASGEASASTGSGEEWDADEKVQDAE